MEFTDNDKTMIENEISELRRQVAVAENTKKIMRLGLNEWQAGRMAECLSGAADVDGFVLEVQKLFAAKEKKIVAALRASATSRGGNYRPASVTQEEFSRMGYIERMRLYDQDPEGYERLSGR